VTNAELDRRFNAVALSEDQQERSNMLRGAFKGLARILTNLPPSREAALAFTALEEASMWAQAANARDGLFE
jgi:hypothetical protein